MYDSKPIKVDSVKKNFIYQSSYQILSLILPFITAPYISRVLGTEGTGIYSYANSILYFFTMFANLGISNYGSREIAANIDNKEKLSYKFWNIYACHAAVSIISIIVYYIYAFFLTSQYKSEFLWQSIQLFATLFDITWFFSGIQKFKVTVRRNFIIRIISVIAIFSFVKANTDVWKYLAILAIGNFVGQVVVWTQLRKYLHFSKINSTSILKHLKPMTILFIPIIAMSIYRYMDKVMIPLFSNISELGLYENAEKIVSLPLSLITTVGIVLLPKMSTIVQTGDKEQQNKYFNVAMKFSLIFAMGLAGGLIGVSPVFVPIFFGEAFQRCSSLISLLAVTVLFLTWSNSIRSQYLIPNKKDKAFIIAAFSGAVINLIFNIILISKYGAAGAVIATIATEFVVALIHTLCSYKELQFKIIIKNVCPFVIPAIMMTLIVRVIGDILFGSILTVILQVAIGGSFYAIFTLAILWYQKDSYFISIKNSLLKRRR